MTRGDGIEAEHADAQPGGVEPAEAGLDVGGGLGAAGLGEVVEIGRARHVRDEDETGERGACDDVR